MKSKVGSERSVFVRGLFPDPTNQFERGHSAADGQSKPRTSTDGHGLFLVH
jgi:hypothetical protein